MTTLQMSLSDSELRAVQAEGKQLTLWLSAASAERAADTPGERPSFGHVGQAWLRLDQARWQLSEPVALDQLRGRIGAARVSLSGSTLHRWPLPGRVDGSLQLSLSLPHGLQLQVDAASMACGHDSPLRWHESMAC